MDSCVSFKARIRPTTMKEFTETGADIYHKAAVNHPWTAKETVKATKALTKDVLDCTAGGIINENTKEVILFHICPTQTENRYFDDIKTHIINMLGTSKGKFRGFLIGSQDIFKDSKLLMKRFQKMMKDYKIPTTVIKGTKDKTHILYDGAKDEWLITSFDINNKLRNGQNDGKAILQDCFENIHIADGDIIS